MAATRNMLIQIFNKASEQTKIFSSWDIRLALWVVAITVATIYGRWQILGKGVAVQYLGETAIDLLTESILFVITLYFINLIRAPFLIIIEQNASIASFKRYQDREKSIIRLRELRCTGVELRNRGIGLLHIDSVDEWWQEHLTWRGETAKIIESLDKEQAERWKTLDRYTPRNAYTNALTPEHRHCLQMFDEWLQRLDLVTEKLKESKV